MEFFRIKGQDIRAVDQHGCIAFSSSKRITYRLIEIYAGSLCILDGSRLVAMTINGGVYLFDKPDLEIKNVVAIPRNYSNKFHLLSNGQKVKSIDNEIELRSLGTFYLTKKYMESLYTRYKFTGSVHTANNKKIAIEFTKGCDSIFDKLLNRESNIFLKLAYKHKYMSTISALILFSIKINYYVDR